MTLKSYWDDFLDGIYTQTIELGADEKKQVLKAPRISTCVKSF